MKHLKEFFVNSFFTYLAIELVEEALEDLVALGISNLIIKGASTLLVCSATTVSKMGLKTLIKRITYKEGNDKVSALKKFFTWLWCNKKTIIGTIFSAVSGVATVIATNTEAFLQFPEIVLWGFNITPIICGILVFAGVEIGVLGKGFETISKFFTRKENEAIEKETKAIEKEAKAEIVAEEKLANQTQAQQEKALAKAEQEAKEKAAKEAAEAEHKAKVEAIKAKLLAEKQIETTTKTE